MSLKTWWRGVRPRLLGAPIQIIANLLVKTTRFEVINEESTKVPGTIMAIWHGRSLLGAYGLRGQGAYALISHSNDGQMQNTIFRRFGFKTIRGSTGRGGTKALVEIIRVLKKGERIAFTPDGPRGPTHVVQSGLMVMAQKSGGCIVPSGSAAKPCWHAKSWDRYMIPKPFGKSVLIFGEPIPVPRDATPEQVEEIRLHVEAELNRLELEAEIRAGHRPPLCDNSKA